MKTKLKIIGAWIVWLAIWITAITWMAFKDSIDLYFEKQALISEVDEYKQNNDNLRKTKVWLEFKLEKINKEIQWNKEKRNIAKWKLDLINHFLEQGK